MPKGKRNISAAGDFRVTNNGTRTRVVSGHRFPGKGRDGEPTTTVVRLAPREHLQVRSCKSLEVAKATAAQAKAGEGEGS